MSQIDVTALRITNTDLTVVNAARASFAKSTDEMRPRDERLIKYLWEHRHWAPFASCHLLCDMKINMGSADVLIDVLAERGAGIRVKYLPPNRMICAMSLFWALENWELLPRSARYAALERFPVACAASGRKLSDYLAPNTPFLSCNDLTNSQPAIEVDRLRTYSDLSEWDVARLVTFTLHVKGPIFLARQLGKHQVDLVWSEISRRYVSGEPELFSPKVWRKRNPDAKQGSLDEPADWVPMRRTSKVLGGGNVRIDPSAAHKLWNQLAIAYYGDLIDGDIAPEQARMELPQSMLTEWYWTGSVAAFARVHAQRGSEGHGAQAEARQLAALIDTQMTPVLTRLWPEAIGVAAIIQNRSNPSLVKAS